MTLRGRIIRALLTLALIPTAAFAIFTLDQLRFTTKYWYLSGVDRALESALQITKGSLARLETTVLARSSDWAAEWSPGPFDERRRSAIRASLRKAGVDFFQVYRMSGGVWRRVEQTTAEGMMVPEGPDLGEEIPGALESGTAMRSPRGALAGVSLARNGAAIVAGIWVPPDFFEQIENVTQGMTFYHQRSSYVGTVRWTLWLLVPFLVIALAALAIPLATRLARDITRPLSELSAAIERVAAGDLASRVTPSGALELRSLGASFNTMIERLEAARDGLQRAEREAAWRDVARKLAHEFKNMLTPMQLDLQLVRRKLDFVAPGQRDAVTRSLEAAQHEVDNLTRLAEQFSHYARLPEPQFEWVDVAEVVGAAAGSLSQTEVRIAPAPANAPLVRADRLLLSRALHNLLLNAREASPPGSAVEVCTSVAGGEFRIEVLDRGPGIPEGLRPRLFEPYVSTKKRGSGLGLSLVRDIARQHGGAVTLEDRPGGGACARLSLPLTRELGREAASA